MRYYTSPQDFIGILVRSQGWEVQICHWAVRLYVGSSFENDESIKTAEHLHLKINQKKYTVAPVYYDKARVLVRFIKSRVTQL